MFYFNPVEGEGWKTHNKGRGVYIIHTTSGPTTGNETHYTPPHPTPMQVPRPAEDRWDVN